MPLQSCLNWCCILSHLPNACLHITLGLLRTPTSSLTCHSWCLIVVPCSTERGRHWTAYPVTTRLLWRVGPQTAIYLQGRTRSSWAYRADFESAMLYFFWMWRSGHTALPVSCLSVYVLAGEALFCDTQRKEGWLSLCQLSRATFSSPHPKPVPLTIILNSTKQNLTLWSYSFFVRFFFFF